MMAHIINIVFAKSSFFTNCTTVKRNNVIEREQYYTVKVYMVLVICMHAVNAMNAVTRQMAGYSLASILSFKHHTNS